MQRQAHSGMTHNNIFNIIIHRHVVKNPIVSFRGVGITVGVLAGVICGLIGWLVYASTFPDKFDSAAAFLANTSQPYTILTGQAVALVVSTIMCIVISVCCGGCDDQVPLKNKKPALKLIQS